MVDSVLHTAKVLLDQIHFLSLDVVKLVFHYFIFLVGCSVYLKKKNCSFFNWNWKFFDPGKRDICVISFLLSGAFLM